MHLQKIYFASERFPAVDNYPFNDEPETALLPKSQLALLKLLKDMGAVGASFYVARLLYVIRGLVTARFLGPSGFGVWGALNILLGYSNLAPLGSAEAVAREVPFYSQRGDHERVRETKEQAFSFNLYASLFASLAIVIFALVRRGHLETIYYYGFFVVAAGVTLQQALADYERSVLVAALRECDGVQARAARLLGISRSNFNYRVNRLDIQVKEILYE